MDHADAAAPGIQYGNHAFAVIGGPVAIHIGST